MPVQKHDSAEKMFGCKNKHAHCAHAGRKILMTLVGILMIYAIIFLGTSIKNNLKKFYRIGWADRYERTINIQAEGKTTAIPDIAKVEMGTITSAATVAEAQKKNTETMNNLIGKLEGMGIAKDDIQTVLYNINPQYDYIEGRGSVLKGYEVVNTVKVKIRDLSKAGEVLSLAGAVGANTAGGLQFEVDDVEVYREKARKDAMEKVANKISQISKALGVEFVAVTSYSEYDGSSVVYPMYDAKYAMGMGGAESQPRIETGSRDIVLNVNVVFEIR